MELKLLLILLRRWAWLLILGLLLGAGGAYLASQYQEPVYESTTKVMVVRPQESNVTANLTLSDQDLMQTYVTLLTTRPVLQRTAEELGFGVSAGQITARQSTGTRLLEVTVRAGHAERAATIANTLVETLIAYNDDLQASRFASSEDSLQAQISQVETQIAEVQATLQAREAASQEEQEEAVQEEREALEEQIFDLQRQIATLEQEMDNLTPLPVPGGPPPQLTQVEQEQLVDTRTELARLRFNLGLAEQRYSNILFPQRGENTQSDTESTQQEASLTLYQQLYSNLLNAYESVRLARLQNTPNVVQVEAATPNNVPIQPRPLRNGLLGGAVGLILMGAVAFLIEYLDDTIKTPDDVGRAFGLPVIGFVAEMEGDEERPYVLDHPRSPVAEAFRTLRTNLEFAGAGQPIRSILIASPTSKDGKTTVAVNLAAIVAQNGKKALLLEGDLRRPQVHRFLDLANDVGLSDIFRGQVKIGQAIQRVPDLDTLFAITSSSLPPNPAELLGSKRMDEILARLREKLDTIIVDSPPFVVSDSALLAAKVDAVVIVIRPGQTDVSTMQAMLEQLQRVEANVVGVIFNRIPLKRGRFYGGYDYYAPYNYADSDYTNHGANGQGDGQRRRRGILGLPLGRD